MLDQLRKHAGSWLVKVVLTLIILTFIFFFGYTQMASRARDSERTVARVGDSAIPRRKFENMVQSSEDKLKEGLTGDMPAGMAEFLKRNVLDQMITRELIVQFSRDLGLTVSDEELADTIRSNKNLFPDGQFDLDMYERRFLPSYRQRYGEDYETTVRRDLLVEKAQVLMTTLFGPWQSELEASLERMRASAKKVANTRPSETQETQPARVESLSPFDLFSTWLNAFKETVKIEVFESPS